MWIVRILWAERYNYWNLSDKLSRWNLSTLTAGCALDKNNAKWSLVSPLPPSLQQSNEMSIFLRVHCVYVCLSVTDHHQLDLWIIFLSIGSLWSPSNSLMVAILSTPLPPEESHSLAASSPPCGWSVGQPPIETGANASVDEFHKRVSTAVATKRRERFLALWESFRLSAQAYNSMLCARRWSSADPRQYQ